MSDSFPLPVWSPQRVDEDSGRTSRPEAGSGDEGDPSSPSGLAEIRPFSPSGVEGPLDYSLLSQAFARGDRWAGLRIPLSANARDERSRAERKPALARSEVEGRPLSEPTIASPLGAESRPEERGPGPFDRHYWKTIESRLNGPERQPEFPPGADTLDAVGRRELLKLVGASLALAGVGTGCTERPHEKLVPYHRTPELTPGNAQHYATASVLDGLATGVVVTSYEGRPTKIEGNPEHPASLGASGPFEQAELLQLYSPHRCRQLRKGNTPQAQGSLWVALQELAARLEGEQGRGLWFLTSPTSSPLLLSLRERIAQRFPQARFLAQAAAFEDHRYQGTQLAFGSPVQGLTQLDRASVILSLDDDFLQARGANLARARQFATRRTPGQTMNRLYVVECAPTVTGSNADHRLALPASHIADFGLDLLRRLARRLSALAPLAEALPAQPSARFAPHAALLDALAADLLRAGNEAAILVGARQPPELHALAQAINAALGAQGHTLRWVKPPVAELRAGPASAKELASALAKDEVELLVITGWNPLYAGYADVNLPSLLPKAKASVYLTLFEDETAQRAQWVVPALHPLEAWGDARAEDGTTSIIQPLIRPLHGGLCEAELFNALLGAEPASAYQLLRQRWEVQEGAPREVLRWERWVQQGIMEGSRAEEVPVQVSMETVAQALRTRSSLKGQGLEVVFETDPKVFDGRYANNPWLQELPHPVTKLTWDNAAMLGPATARALGLQSREVVTLGYRGQQLEAPVLVVPGHAEGCFTLPLGYGRRGSEEVAHQVGFNAYRLRHSDAPWFDGGLSVEKTGRTHPLSITQEHWTMAGRPLALDTTLSQLPGYSEQLARLRGPLPTLNQPVSYADEPYRWAMGVDLNRCTGCMACVLACQAENNIPVVGAAQVRRGREMHWLRVDRYYVGDEQAPEVVSQPVACVHCESAPCEYVCPVNATVHSDEGLNEMVYNRCVGTRYCSNNCPYKVRRFNYLHYSSGKSPTEQLAMNPEVTVRARGVMEKCSYCVQRIQRHRIRARVAGRTIDLKELQTACQQACPTQAITFGSLHEAQAEVSQWHQSPRRYDLLHELGTRPRTAYLVKVRNPNPEVK